MNVADLLDRAWTVLWSGRRAFAALQASVFVTFTAVGWIAIELWARAPSAAEHTSGWILVLEVGAAAGLAMLLFAAAATISLAGIARGSLELEIGAAPSVRSVLAAGWTHLPHTFRAALPLFGAALIPVVAATAIGVAAIQRADDGLDAVVATALFGVPVCLAAFAASIELVLRFGFAVPALIDGAATPADARARAASLMRGARARGLVLLLVAVGIHLAVGTVASLFMPLPELGGPALWGWAELAQAQRTSLVVGNAVLALTGTYAGALWGVFYLSRRTTT